MLEFLQQNIGAPFSKMLSATETARKAPYHFSIPRLCFHPTIPFPDKGDPIDTNKLYHSSAVSNTTNSHNELSKSMPKNTQPQFRVVVGPRLWDFLTVVQFIGFNDYFCLAASSNNKKTSGCKVVKARHLLLHGPAGCGKSNILMIAAAFLSYRTMTNIYRVAAIGDAKAWGLSGDPYMYFALEILVALRDYHRKSSKKSKPNLSIQAEISDDGETSTNSCSVEDESSLDGAGFLIEPRALSSVQDVITWIMAIRDRLQDNNTNENFISESMYENNSDQLQHQGNRMKLMILVDQSEWLLKHPESIPAQIIRSLMELELEHEENLKKNSDSFPCLLPSVVLVSRTSEFLEPKNEKSKWLKDQLNTGQCLIHVLPSRLDQGTENRVAHLCMRRSLNFLRPFWGPVGNSPKQWERDFLQSGDINKWTGGNGSELQAFFDFSHNIVFVKNRFLNAILAYRQKVRLFIDRLLSESSQDNTFASNLIQVILYMALHLPLQQSEIISDRLVIWGRIVCDLPDEIRSALFLPNHVVLHGMPKSISDKNIEGNYSKSILPNTQILWHSQWGSIAINDIPTAISHAIHAALVGWMFTHSSLAKPKLSGMCSETIRRSGTFALRMFIAGIEEVRARQQKTNKYSTLKISAKNTLFEPVTMQIEMLDPELNIVHFCGMVACPGQCGHPNLRRVVFLPARFDFPYFDIIVWDGLECVAYVLTSSIEIFQSCSSSTSASGTFIYESNTTNDGNTSTTASLTSPAFTPDIQSPQGLLHSWQEMLLEWQNYGDNPEALDTVINAYEGMFLGTSVAGSKKVPLNTPQSPASLFAAAAAFTTNNNNNATFKNNDKKRKKRLSSIPVKVLFVENIWQLLHASFEYGYE